MGPKGKAFGRPFGSLGNIKKSAPVAGIALDALGAGDLVCGVATLTPPDAAASKLPAKSDRRRDDAAVSRDLIDLAMIAPPKALLWKRIKALQP